MCVRVCCERVSHREHTEYGCLYFKIIELFMVNRLMLEIRIKSKPSFQDMNDDGDIHRFYSMQSHCYCCVLLGNRLGIGEAIIIISMIQCVHVIATTLHVGTIAFLLNWHRLLVSAVNCKKNEIFVTEKDAKWIQFMQHVSTHTNDKEKKKKKTTAEKETKHNKLKTEQSNRINVYVASFLLN